MPRGGIAHSVAPVPSSLLSRFASFELGVGSRIVVGQLNPDVAGVFSLEVECMPQIILASPRYNDFFQIKPSFSYEVGLLVIVKDGAFELVVVGRLVDGESQFLVPRMCQPGPAPLQRDLPSRSLPPSSVCFGLLGLLAQSHCTVGVLLSHGLPVGQVLRPVDYSNESADLGPIERHIGVGYQ